MGQQPPEPSNLSCCRSASKSVLAHPGCSFILKPQLKQVLAVIRKRSFLMTDNTLAFGAAHLPELRHLRMVGLNSPQRPLDLRPIFPLPLLNLLRQTVQRPLPVNPQAVANCPFLFPTRRQVAQDVSLRPVVRDRDQFDFHLVAYRGPAACEQFPFRSLQPRPRAVGPRKQTVSTTGVRRAR
jgi:hypothetical protein